MRPMVSWWIAAGLVIVSILVSATSEAKKVEIKDKSEVQELPPAETAAPNVGRERAREYFRGPAASGAAVAPTDHYMAIHLGGYLDSTSYKWGQNNKNTGVGKWTLGVTYRVVEWTGAVDWAFRGDFNSYELPEGKAMKLSFMPLLTFPEAGSRFPLYFGGGLGLGIFFNQIPDESNLSLDYQLVAGARFFNVLETTGFFLEGGLKNHLLLLSDGQFNGVFFAVGSVFTF